MCVYACYFLFWLLLPLCVLSSYFKYKLNIYVENKRKVLYMQMPKKTLLHLRYIPTFTYMRNWINNNRFKFNSRLMRTKRLYLKFLPRINLYSFDRGKKCSESVGKYFTLRRMVFMVDESTRKIMFHRLSRTDSLSLWHIYNSPAWSFQH